MAAAATEPTIDPDDDDPRLMDVFVQPARTAVEQAREWLAERGATQTWHGYDDEAGWVRVTGLMASPDDAERVGELASANDDFKGVIHWTSKPPANDEGNDIES